MERLYKLAIWVNAGSLLLAALVSLIMFLTNWDNLIFSYVFGVLTGLVCFSILLQNGKSMIRQARILKEGEKPVSHFGLYFMLKIVLLLAILGVFAYFQFALKIEKFNLIVLAFGYLSSRIVVIISSLILREKVLY